MTIQLATKTCTTCGETKNVSEFYRNKQATDGLTSQCKPCHNASVKASRERRRAAMGDEAWAALMATRQRARRSDPDKRAKDAQHGQAVNAAMARLRDLHRDEYEHLLRLERHARGLPI